MIPSFVPDFEYCSYNYRGFDIANHFAEWKYNYTREDHPFFHSHCKNGATKTQLLKFIKAYLEEQGSKEDPRKVYEEVRVFSMMPDFFWSLWSVANADVSQIPFGYWVKHLLILFCVTLRLCVYVNKNKVKNLYFAMFWHVMTIIKLLVVGLS